MSRGNQRETDRAKNQAKLQAAANAKSKGGDVLKRNDNDKAALLAKVEEKKRRAEEEAKNANYSATHVTVKPKKKQEKADSLDDILAAGLGKKKK